MCQKTNSAFSGACDRKSASLLAYPTEKVSMGESVLEQVGSIIGEKMLAEGVFAFFLCYERPSSSTPFLVRCSLVYLVLGGKRLC